MAVIKIDGVCTQTSDDAEINALLDGRNIAVRGLNDSRLGLYSHIVRREIKPEIEGSFDNPFCEELNRRYLAALAKKRMFVNELYLSVVLRRLQGKVGAVEKIVRLVAPGSSLLEEVSEGELVASLTEITGTLAKQLSGYGARLLGIERRDDGGLYSEPIEFLDLITNGAQPRPVLLPRMGIDGYIGARRVIVGHRAIELRGATEDDTRFAAMVSLREYPNETGPGMLDGLLHVPREFVITQSFSVVDRAEAGGEMKRVERQTSNSDEGGTRVETDFLLGRNQLHAGEAIFGRHHLTVMCLGHSLDEMTDTVRDVGKELTALGILFVREDLNLELSYWAQLPGNFSYIARSAMISSRNFSGFSSFHNFDGGRPHSNHWGDAVTLLQTTSLTPYYFNFHVSGSDLGNFTIVGPSGSGKTVALTLLLAQAMRLYPRPQAVFFDKDRGAEIFVRALGGSYDVLKAGRPTGFNPFQLPDTPADRAFLGQLVRQLLRPHHGWFTAAQERIIADAVSTIMELPREERHLENLAAALGGSERLDGGDLAARLEVWLRPDARGWLFNNRQDTCSFDAGVVGFDMTDILDDNESRAAALMYIFHRIENELNGQRFMLFLDEAWRLFGDPVFMAFIIDKMKTIRKMNGIVGLGTQSAADIVQAKGSHAILEQTATNIFFPNAKADIASHREAFQLTENEVRWIRRTLPTSRTFLIKHARDSVIARLDLDEMKDLVPVLSGRAETVAEVEQLRAEYGDDPAAWLPRFLKREVWP